MDDGEGVAEASASQALQRSIRDFGEWQDFVRGNFPWLEMNDRGARDFHAEVGARQLPKGVLTSMHLGASEVHRTRRLADAAEAGYLKIITLTAGRIEVEQDQRRCLILPGRASVCDSARPYSIRIDEGARFTVLMLPYEACPGWERISPRICGSRLSEAAAIRSAVAALDALESDADDAGTTAKATVFRAVQWMLTTALSHSAGPAEPAWPTDRRLQQAERYVEQHLDDPALDVDDLAAALCMSRRALYALFQPHRLTPAKMIQDVRLQRSKALLEDPALQPRKITDLAFDCGFNDYATFSRLFKQRYGLTPRALRTLARTPWH